VRCSGANRVHNNKISLPRCWWGRGRAAGTLLGPETTPGPVGWVCVVAPSWWWGVVFGNWIVVASIEADALPCGVVCLFCAILIF
jgi:hypothetical protein